MGSRAVSQVYLAKPAGIRTPPLDPLSIDTVDNLGDNRKMTIQGQPEGILCMRRPSEGNVQSYMVGRRFSLSRDGALPMSVRTRSASGGESQRVPIQRTQVSGVGCQPLPAGFHPGRRYSIQTENPVSRQINQISGATLTGRARRTNNPMPVSIRSVPSSPVLQRRVLVPISDGDTDRTVSCTPTRSVAGRVFPPIANRGPQPYQPPHFYSHQPTTCSCGQPLPVSQCQGHGQSQPSVINVTGNVHISINGDQPVAMLGHSGEDHKSELALWTMGHNGTNMPLVIKRMQEARAQNSGQAPAHPPCSGGHAWNHSNGYDSQASVTSGLSVDVDSDGMGQGEGHNMYWNGEGLLGVPCQITDETSQIDGRQGYSMSHDTKMAAPMSDSWPRASESGDHIAGTLTVNDKLPDNKHYRTSMLTHPVYNNQAADAQTNGVQTGVQPSVRAGQVTDRSRKAGLDSVHATSRLLHKPQVSGRTQRPAKVPDPNQSPPGLQQPADADGEEGSEVKVIRSRRRSVQDLIMGFEGVRRLVTYEEDFGYHTGVEIVELTDNEDNSNASEAGENNEIRSVVDGAKQNRNHIKETLEKTPEKTNTDSTTDTPTSECSVQTSTSEKPVLKSSRAQVSTSEGCAQTDQEEEVDETEEKRDWILNDKATETGEVCRLIPVISELSMQEIQYDTSSVTLVPDPEKQDTGKDIEECQTKDM